MEVEDEDAVLIDLDVLEFDRLAQRDGGFFKRVGRRALATEDKRQADACVGCMPLLGAVLSMQPHAYFLTCTFFKACRPMCRYSILPSGPGTSTNSSSSVSPGLVIEKR